MKRFIWVAFAALSLIFASIIPASAHDGYHALEDWRVLDTGTADGETGWTPDAPQVPSELSEITGPYTATLEWVADHAPSNLGTSLETADLGLVLEAPGTIQAKYTLHDDAEVALGAPRLFAFIGGVNYNSSDAIDGVIEVDLPPGTIGNVGFTYDNFVPGKVKLEWIKLNGEKLPLLPDPTPDPEVCEWDDNFTVDDPECEDPNIGGDEGGTEGDEGNEGTEDGTEEGDENGEDGTEVGTEDGTGDEDGTDEEPSADVSTEVLSKTCDDVRIYVSNDGETTETARVWVDSEERPEYELKPGEDATFSTSFDDESGEHTVRYTVGDDLVDKTFTVDCGEPTAKPTPEPTTEPDPDGDPLPDTGSTSLMFTLVALGLAATGGLLLRLKRNIS